uniref:hypothetical protein n=1 Tax=Paraburkholderia bannensis TaxID=765414 RepID=UPI0038CDB71C
MEQIVEILCEFIGAHEIGDFKRRAPALAVSAKEICDPCAAASGNRHSAAKNIESIFFRHNAQVPAHMNIARLYQLSTRHAARERARAEWP